MQTMRSLIANDAFRNGGPRAEGSRGSPLLLRRELRGAPGAAWPGNAGETRGTESAPVVTPLPALLDHAAPVAPAEGSGESSGASSPTCLWLLCEGPVSVCRYLGAFGNGSM